MNDENATIGIHIELLEILHDFISYSMDEFTKPSALTEIAGADGVLPKVAVPMYLKLTIRCLTSCLRLDLGVSRYAKNAANLSDLLKLIMALRDEEVIAKGCKCIRIALRDERVNTLFLIICI